MSCITINDVKKVQKGWADSVVSSNIDTLINLYTRDAVLKPTLSSIIRVGTEDIGLYFTGGDKYGDKGFLNMDICKVEFVDSNINIIDSVAIDVGRYRFVKNESLVNQTEVINAFYTFCYQKVDQKLLITHHHSSM